MTIVSVVGASGRVGSAIARHLSDEVTVREIRRKRHEDVSSLARRATESASVLVNAAGFAHVARDSDASIERMREANVVLPLELADAALAAGIAFVHISSVKAETPEESEYAASKRSGDDELNEQFGDAFAAADRSLVVVRPLALLFPPLDAGKVRYLRFLGRLPAAMVPAVRVPVLSPTVFLEAVETTVLSAAAGNARAGFSVRSFSRGERGSLRDIAEALRSRH